jgi:hypothetical protein
MIRKGTHLITDFDPKKNKFKTEHHLTVPNLTHPLMRLLEQVVLFTARLHPNLVKTMVKQNNNSPL